MGWYGRRDEVSAKTLTTHHGEVSSLCWRERYLGCDFFRPNPRNLKERRTQEKVHFLAADLKVFRSCCLILLETYLPSSLGPTFK